MFAKINISQVLKREKNFKKFMQTDYTPSSILFAKPAVIVYSNVFGKREFESIAEEVVRQGHKNNRWFPVDRDSLYTALDGDLFCGDQEFRDLVVDFRISEMVDSGWLEKREEGFMLHPEAIERLVTMYPSK
jgi:hypothetical protein